MVGNLDRIGTVSEYSMAGYSNPYLSDKSSTKQSVKGGMARLRPVKITRNSHHRNSLTG